MTVSRFITYRDFPYRPQRHAGESLVGYVYRLMSANGHSISAGGHYRAVQQLYRGDLTQSREILERLSTFIGDPSYQDGRFWAERLCMQYSAGSSGGLSFPKLRADSPWLCPACMQEGPYHREFWTLPLASTCPRHGVSLSACCGVCGGVLTWATLEAGWRCARGHVVYEASPMAAEKSTARDQLLSVHPHFASDSVGVTLLARYQADATSHEMHIAYYWVVAPKRVGAAWGLSLPQPRTTANNPAPPKPEPANVSTVPLSHAFLRWTYLWRIAMRPLGAHILMPLTVLSHVARRRPTRAHIALQHARRQGKQASAAPESLHARRVMQLSHILVYLNDRVPRSVGLSALSHFDHWWAETVQAAKAARLLGRHGFDKEDVHTPKRRQTVAHRIQVETAVVTLLDRLLFAACMLFSANELQGFWKSLILPRSLPGNTRKPTHKRLTAYLMTCPLTELTTWNTQIEADLALRHQELCDALR